VIDIVERLAQQAAETINGGEFYDGKWYTEGQRQAWRKAMTPAADEIERLREALREMVNEKCEYMHINHLGDPETTHTIKLAHKALKGKE